MITLLDQSTINKIAAGEVIERPCAIVKELLENAIDARATQVTVEIKEGGLSFIRVTDNGTGIEALEIPLAFLRHSTSKIKSVEDLVTIKSLGFRGEAIASIAAVSKVELLTKTPDALTGVRYIIEGGEEKLTAEIGCPEGTTFLVRSLFYNTPARRKFLKSSMTEAGYINDLMERIAISHPAISFKLIHNNQVKLQTSGNRQIKDIIYHIFGREITSALLAVDEKIETAAFSGFIGKPVVSRGNKNYMIYFINGRYIKSAVIDRAIEEAYKSFQMAHRYPFTVLYFTIDSSCLDVNVHPTKMEVRFLNQELLFQFIVDTIAAVLSKKELIPEITLSKERNEGDLLDLKKEMTPLNETKTPIKSDSPQKGPEPFEKKRMQEVVSEEVSYHIPASQLTFMPEFLVPEHKKEHRIIGQLFSTYWLVEYRDKLFIMDQHAAHEKVLYEKLMLSLKKQEILPQMLNPPIVLTLSMREAQQLNQHMDTLKMLGFEMEPFGGNEYSVHAVPSNLLGVAQKDLLVELIDTLDDGQKTPDLVLEKAALISCKAAVKGNSHLEQKEAEALIDELMTLENPYHCPHGRPTIISMSKTELEKKFKRIV